MHYGVMRYKSKHFEMLQVNREEKIFKLCSRLDATKSTLCRRKNMLEDVLGEDFNSVYT